MGLCIWISLRGCLRKCGRRHEGVIHVPHATGCRGGAPTCQEAVGSLLEGGWCVRLPPAPQRPTTCHTQKGRQSMLKIFIFGDSIAYGAWDPAGGWVERLRQSVFATTRGDYNRGTFLYNLSIVGETTAELRRRFPTELAARQPEPGDLIMFATGINDA